MRGTDVTRSDPVGFKTATSSDRALTVRSCGSLHLLHKLSWRLEDTKTEGSLIVKASLLVRKKTQSVIGLVWGLGPLQGAGRSRAHAQEISRALKYVEGSGVIVQDHGHTT
ncbi:hypothetical protein EMCRGX_G012925 [Ephydatia muelleri]